MNRRIGKSTSEDNNSRRSIGFPKRQNDKTTTSQVKHFVQCQHKSSTLGSVPLMCSAMKSNFLIWEALPLPATRLLHYEHVIDSFHAVEHNNMAAKIFGAAIFVWILQFKSTLGIGYMPVNPPISNYSKDENTTVYTVQQNETLRVSIKRINKEFEQILYKDGERILGLERSNKTVYVNDSGSDQDQLEKVQTYFHMKILNESYVQVIIYCGTNFVEGNYIVQYNGKGLLDEPHPLRFSVKFADYFTDSLPSTSPSASFFPSSQSLAPTTQTMDSTLQSPTMLRKSVSDESSESQNLSGGLIAVIVIAVVVAIIIAVVLLFYCCYRFNGKFKSYYQQGLNLLPFTRSQEPHNNRNNDLEPRNEITLV